MIVLKDKCNICGNESEFIIDDKATLLREAKCSCCGASVRNSDVAGSLLQYFGVPEQSLNTVPRDIVSRYHILNTCSSGYIHSALEKNKTYECSEYIETVTPGEYYEGILSVDLTRIPFPDNSLDIIISEDVFEHVADYDTAFREIFRVLKPGGVHVFTVPIHDGRKTESRDGKNKVYHEDPNPASADPGTLVFTDWGEDIGDILAGYGFKSEVERKHIFYKPEEVSNLDVDYEGYLENRDNLQNYLKYNSIVIYSKKPEDLSADLTVNDDFWCQHSVIRDLNKEILFRNERIRSVEDDNEARGKHIVKLDAHIEDLGHEIELRDRTIADKEQIIASRDQTIADKEKIIAGNEQIILDKEKIIAGNEQIILDKEKIIAGNEQLIADKEKIIVGSEEIIANKEQAIAAKEQIIADKNIIISTQEQTIEKCNEEIDKAKSEIEQLNQIKDEYENQKDAFESRIAELEQIVRNKEGHIEQLLEVERVYERDKASRSYKIALGLRKISHFFFPENSKRRFFAKVILRCIRHPSFIPRALSPKRIKTYFQTVRTDGMEAVNMRYKYVENFDAQRVGEINNESLDLVETAGNGTGKDICEYEKLEFVINEAPEVSIVIPVYNQFDYTYNCLKSIQKHSGDVTYEIIIADDCSTDSTEKIKEIVTGINVIRNENNLRFLLNCNNAAKYAKGQYILFLNNDTQVQKDWLQPLVDLMNDASIGMVGSKLVYSDGRLQEAGGILWKDGSAWNYGNKMNPEDPEYNYVKEVDYISGAAIMIRKSLWEEIGGFDERFAPAYCEDSDLAFEVRKHGYKVVYQPLSVVVHFEGVSNGTDLSSGQKSYQVINQKKFFEKWKDELEKNHFPNAENVFMARDRSRNKPVLLMVDHYAPQYDKDAGSRTVYSYLQLFLKKGYNVKFIGDNFFRDPVYTTAVQQLGIEIFYGLYYSEHWKDWIKQNGSYINYAFLNRPHISVKYIDFIRQNTKAKIMYYGHDLHFLREYRSYELTGDPAKKESSEDWKNKELELINKSDVVYYPSQVEIDEVRKLAPNADSKAIVAYMYNNVEERVYDYDARKDIMFIGGFGHPPNEDGVMWFLKEVFPIVHEALPEMVFNILGSNPTDSIKAMANEYVKVKGFVSDEELADSYNSSRISVVPLRVGAGIKGKVIEAMSFGVPVVTTTIGAEGIIGAESFLCIEDDPREMAQKIIKLYNDKTDLSERSIKSIRYIKDNFSEDGAWKVIKNDFI